MSSKYLAICQICLVLSKKLSQCYFLAFFMVFWYLYLTVCASTSIDKRCQPCFQKHWARFLRLLNFALNMLKLLLQYVLGLAFGTNFSSNADIRSNNCAVYLFKSKKKACNLPAFKFTWISSWILAHGAFLKRCHG